MGIITLLLVVCMKKMPNIGTIINNMNRGNPELSPSPSAELKLTQKKNLMIL